MTSTDPSVVHERMLNMTCIRMDVWLLARIKAVLGLRGCLSVQDAAFIACYKVRVVLSSEATHNLSGPEAPAAVEIGRVSETNNQQSGTACTAGTV